MERIIAEKKKEYAVEAHGLLRNFKEDLGISGLENVRLLNLYYVDGLEREELEGSIGVIFSEPSVDEVCIGNDDLDFDIPGKSRAFGVRLLPGQYDQRADSAEQAIMILTGKEAKVRCIKIVVLEGNINDSEFEEIKKYMINPTDMEEASLTIPTSIKDTEFTQGKPETYVGFRLYTPENLENFIKEKELAMSVEDLKLIQKYFAKDEGRDPTETEIKMIDTYWSDHCRHTTFETELTGIKFSGTTPLAVSFSEYLSLRDELYGEKEKPISLMDMATIGAKAQRKRGLLDDEEVSGEINAASVEIDVNHGGENEKWLMMFKNETHNHPTEIEPFGGAATCLGGAIRDPLSGRSYVHQAMRITGAADPNTPISETLPGKIPQRKLTRTAALGYSSYGNQIGIATGKVREHYHPNYVAKRLELGAVIGAVRKDMVRREEPESTDVVILIGGLTGRDGLGGATGSSKSQNETSIQRSGAEVQKGNPPEERKILRLFRNPEVTKLIKKCNDFGAGGVSIAIGELARGLDIDLDKVPLKYEGVNATDIALSESQERMAVVVAKEDAEKFIELSNKENLRATIVANVSDSGRLRMTFQGETIVDISRDFLDTNGAKTKQHAALSFNVPHEYFVTEVGDVKEKWFEVMGRLNGASQKGLKDRFDFSVGAGTVLAPLGGANQLTDEEGMVAKIPVEDGNTTTCSAMACGFYPHLAESSTYHGAVFAVVNSICKLICYGVDPSRIRLSFQEYFGKLRNDPKKWGQVVSALLGALSVQMELNAPSIGGKDSMSGTFENIDVPPTFVSFAAGTTDVSKVNVAPLQGGGSSLYLLETPLDDNLLPDLEMLKENIKKISGKKFKSLTTVKHGGIAETLTNRAFGNGIGFRVDVPKEKLFVHMSGSFIAESDEPLEGFIKIGETTDDGKIHYEDIEIDLKEIQKVWEGTLEEVFPTDTEEEKREIKTLSFEKKVNIQGGKTGSPKALVIAFPGTNSEYDTKNALDRAGAKSEIFLFRNRNANDIEESVNLLSEEIKTSQIVVIPGGFSAGDEPEGSAKYIATAFRNPKIKEAVDILLKDKDGLMLGICNGFQTLIKLGLLPYGEIRDLDENSPTLTYNSIGRHQATMINARISSNLSPWYSEMKVGEIYKMPISHGEGRFIANDEVLNELINNGQVASQYVDLEGNATMDIRYNPNGSFMALESMSDPSGRILGKMGHAERVTEGTYLNIPDIKIQPIFLGGVNYFK